MTQVAESMDIASLVKQFLPVVSLIVGYFFSFYKFKKEMSDKTTMQDFERMQKYFSGEGLAELKQFPSLIKDAACETVSYFRTISFEEIEMLLEVEAIKLADIRKIGYLKKNGVIEWDSTNKKFKAFVNYLWWKRIFSWLGFAIYVGLIFCMALKVDMEDIINTVIFFFFLAILILIVEVPFLNFQNKLKECKQLKKNHATLSWKELLILPEQNNATTQQQSGEE
ncbi:hypothetical protein [Neisseria zalophi]|uniref:Uncharacterized protein n=1 Tax=Neisseria zalophi TaxID=640030 RepID=A0A5J6Q1A9_9NEIS|nr:hypothetical protein [Neisseria zalophi]QEY26730.1 hypothetical protein D0T92_09440 [Neisseria zalophi]